MVVLEMSGVGGGGVALVQKFLKYKVDGSYGYGWSEYKVVYQ